MTKDVEKRKTKRMVVQDSFSIFLVIPEKNGMVRIYIKDMSKAGICFQVDDSAFFSQGTVIDLRLYLNAAFYIPVRGKVVRVSEGEVAVEFLATEDKTTKAIAKLVDFFEAASDIVVPS